MRQRPTCDSRSRLADVRQGIVKKFAVREDGSMTLLALFLIPMMLILAGMAVDFMRYEGRRTVIQDTADRAALLAASLEYTDIGTGVTVVDDYFRKAGLHEYLDGPAIVTENINNRTVEVNVTQPMDTFFLHLAGIDSIDAKVQSIATQGVGNVEISLVLDISGSMSEKTTDSRGRETNVTKIEALREAATSFVNTALQDSNADRVSLSLVPYSEHVNIGKDLFDRMNTDEKHNFSHCIDFDDTDFAMSGISAARTYSQSQHIDVWSTGNTMNYVNCPTRSFEEVTAVTQNRSALVTQISKLQPTMQTSIFLGMKWGLALLDPTMSDVVASDDVAFANRPSEYSTETETNDTRKVIVVMTDGNNTNSRRIKTEFYDNPDHYAQWAEQPLRTWADENTTYSSSQQTSIWNKFTDSLYDTDEGNRLLKASCDAAKAENVQVFAIAFEAGANGENAMKDCATDEDTHYFNTNGDDLNAVFLAIAEQVTDLRLTQ